MDVLAAASTGVWGQWVWPVLQFALGLALVILVHEFGHFIVAKKVGIQVDRFAIGFGPRLFGIRRGGTDYCVNLLFLGGYVKMLGQEDVAPLADNIRDPRAFCNKPVGVRLMVIAAGVVMNVILAVVLFIVVGLVGKEFHQSVVGGVRPGSPAESARITWDEAPAAASRPATGPVVTRGLEPGDRITEIDGRQIRRFDQLVTRSLLAGADSRFRLRLVRKVDGRTWTGTAEIGVERTTVPNMGFRAWGFGVERPSDTVMGLDPAEEKVLPFRDGDRLVAIGGRPIRHFWDIRPAMKELTGQEIPVAVIRDGRRIELKARPKLGMTKVLFLADGRRLDGEVSGTSADGKTVTVALAGGGEERIPADSIPRQECLDLLGMVPRLRVRHVVRRSPAERAKLQLGDIILNYGDRAAPTHRQFVEISRECLGSGTRITVLRDGKRHEAIVSPKKVQGGAVIGVWLEADQEHLVIAGVREDSPAARAHVQPGDVMRQVNGTDVSSWPDVLALLKQQAGQDVTLTLARTSQTVVAPVGRLDRAAFNPDNYACRLDVAFRPLMVKIVKRNPLAAAAWGAEETWRHILTGYLTLRRLMSRDLSTKAIVGPVGMVDIGIQLAREGPIHFVYLMALISAILAVMNFLPIPVVDGGHAVFLLIEKVRGKPLPVKVLNAVQMAGLAALALLFLYVTYNDIVRFVQNML